jgi:hypothetical protein
MATACIGIKPGRIYRLAPPDRGASGDGAAFAEVGAQAVTVSTGASATADWTIGWPGQAEQRNPSDATR